MEVYTQNANECANSLIKNFTEGKLPLKPFVEQMRSFIWDRKIEVRDSQRDASDSVELLPEYAHLRIEKDDFWTASTESTAKEKMLNRIFLATLVIPEKGELEIVEMDQCISEKPLASGDQGSFWGNGVKRSRDANGTDIRAKRTRGMSEFTFPQYGTAVFPHFKRLDTPRVMLACQKAQEYASDDTKLRVAPGGDPFFFTASSSKDVKALHSIQFHQKTGQITCTGCLAYSTFKFCAHAFAVAVRCQSVTIFVQWYDQKGGVRSKAVKATQVRKGTTAQREEVEQIASTSGTVIWLRKVRDGGVVVSPAPYTSELHFLADCHGSVSSCYGCRKTLKKYLPSPSNIVIVSHQYRSYRDPKTNKEKNGEMGNAYYHLSLKCIEERIPAKLDGLHKKHLKAVLNIVVD
ncbi:hypothetical protein BV898_18991 [Hypsibius exemplaris]|uniref:SWIM-type domain-containing protein n=1 Tax=Hypsibius exemplaris TaxID=2072580 RepID=A0A9X6RPC3_HYPEX|nr:hypothetical protein BV898_18991 [Hypsibius exemplaris]